MTTSQHYINSEVLVCYVLQDVDDYYSLKFPKLYYPGLVNSLFNKKVFAFSVAEVTAGCNLVDLHDGGPQFF